MSVIVIMGRTRSTGRAAFGTTDAGWERMNRNASPKPNARLVAVAWGSLATPADVGAWLREHRGCVSVPVARPLTHATIRCASVDEARVLARDMRRTHVVGRLNASLLVRPREIDRGDADRL